MLETISWNEFLIAVASTVGIYYALAIGILYRAEIVNALSPKPAKPSGSSDSETPEPSTQRQFMGSPRSELKNDVFEAAANMEEIQVQSASEPLREIELSRQTPETLLIGTIADLLQEIKFIVNETPGSGKDELGPLFNSLLSKYSSLINTRYQETITLFIHSTLSEPGHQTCSLEEIRSWWPAANDDE